MRKNKTGGLKLAYLSLSQRNWEHCKLLQICGKPCWTWFCVFHQTIKSAKDSLAYSIAMASEWHSAAHLIEIAKLCSPQGLRSFEEVMHWAKDAQVLAATAWNYNQELLAQRCGSLSKHGIAPHCYAPILGDDFRAQQATLKLMKQDFKFLQHLEVSEVPQANILAADLRLSVCVPVRLIMNALDVTCFRLSEKTDGALDMLRSMLEKIPDSKTIEDLHQKVRGKQNARSNDKVSLGCLQWIINFSKIIEQRSVLHPAAVTKQVFRQYYRQTDTKSYKEKKLMKAKGHKLPKVFSRLLNPKIVWRSVTEASLVRSAAAWSWVRLYQGEKLARAGVEIHSGQLNLACVSGIVLQKANDERAIWLVLKEHTWATMAWPLTRLDSVNLAFDTTGQATWLHVFEADDFVAVPAVACWSRHGLALAQTGDPEPLLKYVLRKPSAFVYNTLLILGRRFGVCTGNQKPARKTLLQGLAESQCGGDAEYVAKVLEADVQKVKSATSNQSDLVECLYDQLELDERMEYRELKNRNDQSAKVKKQQRWQKWLKDKQEEQEARMFSSIWIGLAISDILTNWQHVWHLKFETSLDANLTFIDRQKSRRRKKENWPRRKPSQRPEVGQKEKQKRRHANERQSLKTRSMKTIMLMTMKMVLMATMALALMVAPKPAMVCRIASWSLASCLTHWEQQQYQKLIVLKNLLPRWALQRQLLCHNSQSQRML